jgi:hypothetical protein
VNFHPNIRRSFRRSIGKLLNRNVESQFKGHGSFLGKQAKEVY